MKIDSAKAFMQRFLDNTNTLRKRLNERPITESDLQRVGAVVVACDCDDPTCPGWGLRIPERGC